jgi:Flp pilus assembly protein protease CpaA
MEIVITSLLVIVILGAIAFDFRYKRIPNGVTIPLLLGFMVINWPGKPEIWMGCFLLFVGWQMGWMGGGDAKLWMALLWATPIYAAAQSLWVMVGAFILTGLGQIVWRKWRNSTLTGVQSPGSWRTLPYLAWMIYRCS